LCGSDFGKLLEVERKLKNNFVFWVPGDKEALDYVLGLGEGSGWFKLTWMMCEPMCRFKEIPQLTGLIYTELEENRCRSCWHLKYKAQWGIHWNDEDLNKWIHLILNFHLFSLHNNGGLPYHWMDKDLFEIARPCYNDNDELLWDWDFTLNKPIEL
jgi:hypothetical protein